MTKTVAILVLTAATGLTQARTTFTNQPETIYKAADVVTNGRVVDIILTDEKSTITYDSQPPVKVKIAEAIIDTIGLSKGDAPEQILLKFPVYDIDFKAPHSFRSGVVLPKITKNERYRFYLNRQNDHFVTVRHGEFDCGFAVQPLSSGEPDDSMPLFEEEAEDIALREFRRFRPSPEVSTISGQFHQSCWTFTFYTPPPLSLPSFTSDAEITVDGARRISPRSSIGAEKPRLGSTISNDDLNRPMRITVKGNFPDGTTYSAHPNQITILYGMITKAEDGNITGEFTSPYFSNPHHRELMIPLGKVGSIQLLAVTPKASEQ